MTTAIATVNPVSTDHRPTDHRIVSHQQWLAERKALLEREKELTHLRDQIARERRALPWVRMDKDYVFDTPQGPRRLADLFDGRHQLVLQHFMLPPGWEQGCKSCSYMADHTDATLAHLAARDTSFVAVSRAPLADIERFRQRMGWTFPWVSSHGTDFNRDFHVTFTPEEKENGTLDYNFGGKPHGLELPGVSVFWKDDAGEVFRTYSTYGRGVEVMMHTYNLLDLTPKGRDEDGLDFTMAWVRHHDRYETAPANRSCCAWMSTSPSREGRCRTNKGGPDNHGPSVRCGAFCAWGGPLAQSAAILSWVLSSKSLASCRSRSWLAGSPCMRLTMRPRFTAGRAPIVSAQRWTFLYSVTARNSPAP